MKTQCFRQLWATRTHRHCDCDSLWSWRSQKVDVFLKASLSYHPRMKIKIIVMISQMTTKISFLTLQRKKSPCQMCINVQSVPLCSLIREILKNIWSNTVVKVLSVQYVGWLLNIRRTSDDMFPSMITRWFCITVNFVVKISTVKQIISDI